MSHAEHAHPLTAADVSVPAGHPFRKIPTIALAVGAVGLLASIGLGFGNPKQFYFSWLVSFLYFLSFALGGFFFVITQYAVRAGWSVVVRRIAENMMVILPIFVVLFIPVALGLHDLFHWTQPGVVDHDPVLHHKAAWLNVPGFFVRAVIYFGLWSFLGWFYWKRSIAQDKSGEVRLTRQMQNLSGPAIILFGFSVTAAAIDWIMGLTPHWYSTMYGVYYFAGCLVAMYGGMSLVALRLSGSGLTKKLINAEHFHDLGKLLFAFVVFWTYIAFAQYMLIWYGNIPEETVYFRPRWGGGWEYVTILLCVGHFIIPFFFLMSRHIKRNRAAYAAGALWMLFIHLVDMYWLVMPTLHPGNVAGEGLKIHPLDFTTLLAVGGVTVFAFSRMLFSQPLVPIRDPRLPESINFENA